MRICIFKSGHHSRRTINMLPNSRNVVRPEQQRHRNVSLDSLRSINTSVSSKKTSEGL